MTPSDSDPSLAALERAMGYSFRDRLLLKRALTHASSTAEKPLDNERMEFFGDAVLDLVVCEWLYRNLPDVPEGRLTGLRAAVVCSRTLGEVGRGLGLRDCMRLGKSIAQREHVPPSVYADAYEALVAAVYLDGGLEAARSFVLRTLEDSLLAALRADAPGNAKNELQEILQKAGMAPPTYRVVRESGPDHDRWFEVTVLIGPRPCGTGQGSSKKEAEQIAAQNALPDVRKLLIAHTTDISGNRPYPSVADSSQDQDA